MKISVPGFKGMMPIVSNTKLPDGYASLAINTKLVSGDLDSFADIGNPFQLAKSAIINTIWLMAGPPPNYWLQWSESEVSYGTNIDVALGTIPGDSTYRTYITGLAGGPQQTNLFYAADPSQQGASPAGAYPYTLFLLGIASPASAPTVVPPAAGAGPVTEYDIAAQRSVNDAVVNAVGSGYSSGEILTGIQGTIPTGLHGFQILVNFVTSSGAIDTAQSQAITLLSGGFYETGGDPPTTGATVTSSGGGSGATFDLTLVSSSFGSFGTYEVNNGAGYFIDWTESDGGNNIWRVASGQGDLTVAYSTQIYNLKTAPQWSMQMDAADDQVASGGNPTDLVMYLMGVYNGAQWIAGPGVVISDSDGTFTLYDGITPAGGSTPVGGTVVSQVGSLTFTPNTFYRVTATLVAQSASASTGFVCTATVAEAATPGTIIATVSGFVAYQGESLGVGTNHRGGESEGNDGQFQNILITVTSPVTQISETTAYVYTYVTTKGADPNSINEESGPSDPSPVVTFYLDTTTNPVTMSPVEVTIPPAPAGQSITSYNLYRLVALSDGSEVFEFVATLTASTTDPVVYEDKLLDSALGNEIPSATWVPPPSDLQGILALPNGIMAGFFANTLCLSAQNFPFAWPIGNQLPTDYPIVAIAAIDSTVLILTSAHPYTAWGNDPTAYSMSKETANQGCVSKRSAATHKRLGVVYASGNGLCYYRGQGELDLIRMPNGDPYFSIEQWQALDPSTIQAVIHDDKYWFWYDNGTKGGYCLDLSPAGFGLIALDTHVTAAFVDPATDNMYFCLDNSLYPVNGSVVAAAQNIVNQWEGGGGLRTRSWQRDEYLLPRPASMMLSQVDAEDYSDITLTLASESGSAYNEAVTAAEPFVISSQPGRRWSIALTGSSVVNRVQLCESASELAPS